MKEEMIEYIRNAVNDSDFGHCGNELVETYLAIFGEDEVYEEYKKNLTK